MLGACGFIPGIIKYQDFEIIINISILCKKNNNNKTMLKRVLVNIKNLIFFFNTM